MTNNTTELKITHNTNGTTHTIYRSSPSRARKYALQWAKEHDLPNLIIVAFLRPIPRVDTKTIITSNYTYVMRKCQR